ncbi:helix-turn-helix domain containing protein [Nocardia abscessus]|nr:helix-turn-helix domain containing protein [Nocardia abscessus]
MSTRPELWLEILQAPERHRLTVTEVCRRYRISRKTYYSYLARYRAQGVAGLVPRSRRPKRFPSRSSAAVEAAVVRIRLNRPQWGARRIRAELMRGSTSHVPAISTLHAISRRHGLVGAQPNTRCPRGFGNSTSSCTAGRGRSHRSPTWTTRRGRALFASTPTARSAAAKAKCRSAPSSSGRPCTRPNTTESSACTTATNSYANSSSARRAPTTTTARNRLGDHSGTRSPDSRHLPWPITPAVLARCRIGAPDQPFRHRDRWAFQVCTAARSGVASSAAPLSASVTVAGRHPEHPVSPLACSLSCTRFGEYSPALVRLREEVVRSERTKAPERPKSKGKEVAHSLPLSTYSAPRALRQGPGSAAQSPAEARCCGNRGRAQDAWVWREVEPPVALAVRCGHTGRDGGCARHRTHAEHRPICKGFHD